MKTKILIIGLKVIGLAALMLAACSTANKFIILVAVAVILFLLVGRTKSLALINNLMLAGAGLGLIIGLSASHLADAVRHQGLGIEMWRDSDNGVFLILCCVWGWFLVADYAEKTIRPSGNPEN